MRFRFLVLMVLMAVSGSLLADAKDDAAAADLKKFAGTWEMVSGKRDGQSLASEDVAKSRITWKGNEVMVDTPHQSKDTIKAMVATLDPTRKPKAMDWTRANGPDAGKKMLAIYEFTGPDEYRVVFAPAGKARPKDFDSKAGSQHHVHVWKRVKT
jgi:uncharacterized protein (TIGR03067 family)